MSVKRIGVLTSGGDAPGMNAAVRAVVRTCLYHGIEVYGIRRGWNGLIHGDIIKMDASSVSRTINRGGTILYTARSKEFMTEEGQKRAVSTCKFLGLDSIIAIGGDGTFRGARPFPSTALMLSASPELSITISAAPTTALVLIPQQILRLNVSINFATPCSPMSAALLLRLWAAMPASWLCMWAWLSVQLQCLFLKRKSTLRRMLSRSCARQDFTVSLTT